MKIYETEVVTKKKKLSSKKKEKSKVNEDDFKDLPESTKMEEKKIIQISDSASSSFEKIAISIKNNENKFVGTSEIEQLVKKNFPKNSLAKNSIATILSKYKEYLEHKYTKFRLKTEFFQFNFENSKNTINLKHFEKKKEKSDVIIEIPSKSDSESISSLIEIPIDPKSLFEKIVYSMMKNGNEFVSISRIKKLIEKCFGNDRIPTESSINTSISRKKIYFESSGYNRRVKTKYFDFRNLKESRNFESKSVLSTSDEEKDSNSETDKPKFEELKSLSDITNSVDKMIYILLKEGNQIIRTNEFSKLSLKYFGSEINHGTILSNLSTNKKIFSKNGKDICLRVSFIERNFEKDKNGNYKKKEKISKTLKDKVNKIRSKEMDNDVIEIEDESPRQRTSKKKRKFEEISPTPIRSRKKEKKIEVNEDIPLDESVESEEIKEIEETENAPEDRVMNFFVYCNDLFDIHNFGKTENLCVTCKKAGDNLYICKYPNCQKVVHKECDSKFLSRNSQCNLHFCDEPNCKNPPTIFCKTCTISFCDRHKVDDDFYLENEKDHHVFCADCIDLIYDIRNLGF
eukprot:gene6296-10302_t